MYSKITGKTYLKQYHHVKVDREMKLDSLIWMEFLKDPESMARPFMDFDKQTFNAYEIAFATDASKGKHLGFSAVFRSKWCYSRWESGFIEKENPSTEFLELYALTVGIFLWAEKLQNR